MITGAVSLVEAVASRALRPRTPEYPYPEPCFWYPWTSTMVSSTSTKTKSSPDGVPNSGAFRARLARSQESGGDSTGLAHMPEREGAQEGTQR